MPDPESARSVFKPQIAVFLCQKCCDDPPPWTDVHHPAQIRTLHNQCAAEVGAIEIKSALGAGADGVLILGCLLADCLTGPGHVAALQYIYRNQNLLSEMGLPTHRLRHEWVAPCEAKRIKEVLEEFTDTIQRLGPVPSEIAKRCAGGA